MSLAQLNCVVGICMMEEAHNENVPDQAMRRIINEQREGNEGKMSIVLLAAHKGENIHFTNIMVKINSHLCFFIFNQSSLSFVVVGHHFLITS